MKKSKWLHFKLNAFNSILLSLSSRAYDLEIEIDSKTNWKAKTGKQDHYQQIAMAEINGETVIHVLQRILNSDNGDRAL